jgi:membrane-associated phospholipid phosphatase
MNSKKIIASFFLALLLVAGSYYFLDQEIALFVQKVVWSGKQFSLIAANIPDTLFLMVCIITSVAWAVYLYDRYKGLSGNQMAVSMLIGVSLPVTFFLKSVLKFIFGGINTRYWLAGSVARDFRWFHGDENYSGFPSGHMAVFTALLLGMWEYYPRYRPAYIALLFALALALILTDYHFLSDIIAGAYLGYIVHYGTRYSLIVLHGSVPGKIA